MRVVGLENVDMVPSHGVTTTDSSRGTRLSTSLLYQRLSVSLATTMSGKRLPPASTFFRIEQPRERLRCSACGSAAVWGQGGVERSFRALAHRQAANGPGTQGAPRLLLRLRRDPPGQNQLRRTKKHYTRAFARYVLERLRRMTIQDVADHLLVSWDTIKERFKPRISSGNSASPICTNTRRSPSMRSTSARATAT